MDLIRTQLTTVIQGSEATGDLLLVTGTSRSPAAVGMPLGRRVGMLLATFVVACSSADGRPGPDSATVDSIARARQDSINRALPGYVVDSILTPAEAIRRFRATLGGDSVTRFAGGATSRDALVRRFVSAVATRDTVALASMVVTAREFADLYYLDSPYARRPYRQPPQTAWMLIENHGVVGIGRLLRAVGSTALRYVSHRCDGEPLREGRTVRHADCSVRVVQADTDTVEHRLFGSIVERDGHFKFLSFSNGL